MATQEEQVYRTDLESRVGQVWTTQELRDSVYEVIGFMAPYCVTKNRDTGARGTFQFNHSPRYFYGYIEENQ